MHTLARNSIGILAFLAAAFFAGTRKCECAEVRAQTPLANRVEVLERDLQDVIRRVKHIESVKAGQWPETCAAVRSTLDVFRSGLFGPTVSNERWTGAITQLVQAIERDLSSPHDAWDDKAVRALADELRESLVRLSEADPKGSPDTDPQLKEAAFRALGCVDQLINRVPCL